MNMNSTTIKDRLFLGLDLVYDTLTLEANYANLCIITVKFCLFKIKYQLNVTDPVDWFEIA